MGAYTCSIGAVDKMVVITMSAEVTKSNAKLSYTADTNFVVGVKIRFRQGADIS